MKWIELNARPTRLPACRPGQRAGDEKRLRIDEVGIDSRQHGRTRVTRDRANLTAEARPIEIEAEYRTSATAHPDINNCSAETRRPAKRNTSTGKVSIGNRIKRVSDTRCAKVTMTRLTPIDEMMPPNSSSPLLRSGRNATSSISTNSRPLASMANPKSDHERQPVLHRVQRHEGADHEGRAVRQVEDAVDAKNQCEADGEQRVDAADDQSIQELLQDHATRRSRPSAAHNCPPRRERHVPVSVHAATGSSPGPIATTTTSFLF